MGGGVVLKQLNYPISMLPTIFRSVNRIIVNDPCRSCKFPHFYDSTNFLKKKRLSKKLRIIIKMY